MTQNPGARRSWNNDEAFTEVQHELTVDVTMRAMAVAGERVFASRRASTYRSRASILPAAMLVPDEALRGFILTETGRVLAAHPYPRPFMDTAREMLTALHELLPQRVAAEHYGPRPAELSGKLVCATGAAEGGCVIGILHGNEAQWLVYDRPVDSASIMPLTREDVSRALEILEQDPQLF